MSRLQKPLTLPRDPKLLDELNDMMIAIRLHHYDLSDSEDPEAVYKARARTVKPTWENVTELLKKCYSEINKDREDPRRY